MAKAKAGERPPGVTGPDGRSTGYTLCGQGSAPLFYTEGLPDYPDSELSLKAQDRKPAPRGSPSFPPCPPESSALLTGFGDVLGSQAVP